MTTLTVAFDTGPLQGQRTGIGLAVQALHEALTVHDDVQLLDYVLSFRAELTPGTRRLPLPASLAQRAWGQIGNPRVDRWFEGAQVVHGTNYVVPPSRLPSLVSVYDCWFLRHPDDAGGDVRRAGQVLRRAIERGAVVHTSSFATEAVVRDLFPGAPVRTVHLGPLSPPLPADVAPISELDGRRFVVAIGTIERRKNLPALVRAFGRMAADHDDLRLVLAGSPGDDSPAVQAAIDGLGPQLAPRVLLTGRVDDGVRGWLQHHASVLAYPSLDEGFGFPLLDAMQAGVPIVASTAGSIPEVAGDAALLCAADDIDGLAAALSLVLTDDEVRARLIEAGHRQWQQFGWQRCAAQMIELYGLVLRGDVEGLR